MFLSLKTQTLNLKLEERKHISQNILLSFAFAFVSSFSSFSTVLDLTYDTLYTVYCLEATFLDYETIKPVLFYWKIAV